MARNNIAKTLGIIFSVIHFIGFIIVYIMVESSADAQMQLYYVLFFIIDIPVSILYLPIFDSIFDYNIAIYRLKPFILSGILGSLWWYYCPRLCLPKRLGGVWGSSGER